MCVLLFINAHVCVMACAVVLVACYCFDNTHIYRSIVDYS